MNNVSNNWIEQYYFFEYDKSSVKLVKNFAVDDWKESEITIEKLLDFKKNNRHFFENQLERDKMQTKLYSKYYYDKIMSIFE